MSKKIYLLFFLLSFNNIFSRFWYSATDTLAKVKSEIKKIKDVNKRDNLGRTALHIAAADGKLETVKFLVKNGANVNSLIDDKRKFTPLHAALENPAEKYVEVVKFLLDSNANPVRLNTASNKATPIHFLTYVKNKRDFKELLQYFVDACVNINVVDSKGRSLLFWIVQQNKVELLQVLQKEFGHLIDFSLKNKANQSIRTFAISQKGDIAKHLKIPSLPRLSPVVRVNVSGARYSRSDDFTLTMAAATKSDKKYFEAVLKRGGDPNIKDRRLGNTALNWAIIYDKPEYAEIFIKNKKADVSARNKKNQTPMHFVMNISDKGKRKKIILLLVEYGASINAQDQNGNSVLHAAILKAYSDFIAQVIKDPSLYVMINFNLKNKKGKTVLDIAKEKKNKKLIEMLRLHYKPLRINMKDRAGYTPTMLAAMRGDFKTLQKLLRTGRVNLDIKNKNGDTALHLAVRFGNEKAVGLLLKTKFKKRRPKVNLKNKNGNTVLHEIVHIADMKKRIAMTKDLVLKGYNIAERNNKGDTIFHLAAQKQQAIFIKWLRENLFNMFKNKAGQNPLDIAKKTGNRNLIQVVSGKR